MRKRNSLQFLIAVACAGVVLPGVSGVATAATYRWVGDVNGSLSDAANWYNETTATDNDGPTNLDTDVWKFTSTSGSTSPALSTDYTLNRMVFTSSAPNFTFDGTASKFDVIFAGTDPALVQDSSSIVNFQKYSSQPVQVKVNANLAISGSGTGDVQFKDGINGAGGITKVGKFNVSYDYTNGYNGATSFTGGTLSVTGGQAKISTSPSFVFTDATVFLGSGARDALRNASSVTANNATLSLGATNQGNSSTETVGALTINSGSTGAIIYSHPTVARNTTLTVTTSGGQIARNAGGTLIVTSDRDNLGTVGSFGRSQLKVSTVGNAPTLQNGIVPWAVANPSQSQGGLATYDTTNGFDEYTGHTVGPIANSPSTNYMVTTSTENLAADATINSLSIDTSGGAYTLQNGTGTQLTVGGGLGAIFSKGTGAAAIGVSALNFGGEAIVYTEGSAHTLTFNAPVNAAGGLTKDLAGTLILSAANNPGLTGKVTVSGGTLQLDGSLPKSDIRIHTGGKLDGTGSLQFNVAGDVADLIKLDGVLDMTSLTLAMNITGTQTLSEYVIADYSANWVGFNHLVGSQFAQVTGLGGATIQYAGTIAHPDAIVLVIPEPASIGILALGAVGLLGRRRRAAR